MIVGSKTRSGIENGLTSITGEARNDGIVFSSSFRLFDVRTVDEYDADDLRVRARRLLNHIYESKDVIVKEKLKKYDILEFDCLQYLNVVKDVHVY